MPLCSLLEEQASSKGSAGIGLPKKIRMRERKGKEGGMKAGKKEGRENDDKEGAFS